MPGNWSCIGTGWCRRGHEPRTNCRTWPETKDCIPTAGMEPDEQSELMALPLSPWAAVRRQDWQELLSDLNRRIDPLDQALKQAADQRPEVKLLMTHP